MANDDFKISLVGELDSKKTKENINNALKDIRNIQLNVDEITLSQNALRQIQDLHINATVDGLNINNSDIQRQANEIGNQITRALNVKTNSYEVIDKFRQSLSNLGMSKATVKSVSKTLQALDITITSLNESLTETVGKNGKQILNVEVGGIDQFGQAVKITEQYDIANNELIKTVRAVANATEQSSAKTQKSVQTINKNVTDFQNKLKNLKAQYSETVIDSSEFDKVLGDYHKGVKSINDVRSAFADLKAEVTGFSHALDSKNVSMNPVQQALNNMRNMPDTFKGLKSDIEGLKDVSSINIDFQNLETTYTRLNNEITANNGKIPFTKEWTDSYKELSSIIATVTAQIETQQKLESADKSGKTAAGIRDNMDIGKYSADMAKNTADLKTFGENSEKAKIALNELNAAYKKLTDSKGNDKALVAAMQEYEKAVGKAKNTVKELRAEGSKVNEFANKRLSNNISEWQAKNTKAAKQFGAELKRIKKETEGADQITLNKLKSQFDSVKASARELGLLGKGLFQTFGELATKFGSWLSVTTIMMKFVGLCKSAVNELKEIDTLITEISKADDTLSKSDLRNIANNSFDIASKYGKKVSDLLLGVQEASRAGYSDAMGIAELSVAAQGAGDMTADLANQYVIATDKAWKFGGSVEELTKVLDGSNYITNHNALNMTDLAEAMSIAGTTAASFGIDADEATSAMGTMIAVTQQSGSEVARAFRSILLNIRQVSDEEEGIDAEGLTKYENACNALNVSLKETKDGVLQLRDPMEVLKELSKEYVKLDETDLRRTELLNSVGGKVCHVIQKCIARIYLIAGNPLELCTTI